MLFRQVKIYYMKRKLHLSTHNNVAPYLVVAHLDFALFIQNTSYNASCLQEIDT